MKITRVEQKEKKKFHCVTVPSGAFLVRSGGKISVTGNCLHSEAGAKTFTVLKDEMNLSDVDAAGLEASVMAIAKTLWHHEEIIVDKIFSHGEIAGITKTQLRNFVQSRINMCLKNLGYSNMFDVKYNPIADWFYDGITGFMFNDTFSGIGNSYVRDWNEEDFLYETFQEEK